MAERTPGQWLEVLERRLHSRWTEMSVYDAYYEGDHRLAFVTNKFRLAFGNLFRDLTDNYMPLVVDSAAERLRVQGFRFGDSEDADKDAWRIWQANGLDAQSNMVHTEAIKLGEAYWMVTPNGDEPLITCEHPSQVIVAHAPGNRRIRVAALKKWSEDDVQYANVYLPKGVVKYRSTNKGPSTDVAGMGHHDWTQIDAIPNPLGEVPIIPMPNNPSMLRGGRSDLAGGLISLQDGITKLLADALIGSEYQAMPQRVMIGVEPPRNPDTGEIISDLKAMDSRLWYFNNKDAKAHEFQAADLENFRGAMDGLIGDLAAQARIPIYYFRPAAISNISAEALIGLDAGLVSKTNDKKDPFGEGHEDTMRLAFKSINADDPRAKATDAETIWQDTESRSQAQLTDAIVKEVSIGLPFETALERLGYSPQAVERVLTQRETESLLAATLEPDAGVAPVPPTN
jgi:hypothetical protein